MSVVPERQLEDPISPDVIEHRFEAAVDDETRELLFCYNYIYYRFDVGGREIWARSYLKDIECVSLYLPKGMALSHDDAQRVLTYLGWRFRRVQMLDETGYKTVWSDDGETTPPT